MQLHENRDSDQNKIILWFLNFEFPMEEITTKLALQPTRTAIKGQEEIIHNNTNAVKNISTRTFWAYEWKCENNEFIGDIIEKFVDQIIKPRAKDIKVLTSKVSAEFKIAQCYYTSYTPGYHFTVQTLRTLVKANLEIDINYLYQEKAHS